MQTPRSTLALGSGALVAATLFVASTSAWSAPPAPASGSDAGAPPALPPLAVQALTPHVTRITGAAEQENMVLYDTPAGAVLVDTGFPGDTTAAAIRQAITSVTPRAVRFTINTHWHPDHVGFNTAFAQEGTLIAHENVRLRMSAPQTVQLFGETIPPYPAAALPEVTFKNHMRLRIGGGDLEIRHFANAHTDSDSVVFFRKEHVAVLGDIYISHAFPFADQGNGGRILGMIKAFDEIIESVDADDDIVPGHNGPTKGRDLCVYVAMMKDVVATVRAGIAAGKSLAELQAAGLPKYTAFEAAGPIKAPTFIGFVFNELTGKL